MTKTTRKRYFIDRRLQTKYFVLTILLLLTYTLMFAFFLFLPHILPLQFGSSPEEQTQAARMLLNLHKSIWPALGAVVLILGTVSIFVTHKIAGPSYRIKQDLAEIAAGNLDKTIKLRKKDDLQELAVAINGLVGDMRDFVDAMRQNRKTAATCIEELKALVAAGDIDRDRGEQVIEQLQSTQENRSAGLEKYSV